MGEVLLKKMLKLENTQCGFGAGCSTTDQIFEKSWEYAQRCLCMFCQTWKSIWMGPSRNALLSVAGVWCWQKPVTGHQVTVFLLISLCPHISTLNHNCSPWVLVFEKGVCCYHCS